MMSSIYKFEHFLKSKFKKIKFLPFLFAVQIYLHLAPDYYLILIAINRYPLKKPARTLKPKQRF